MDELLKILKRNARESLDDIARMLDVSVEEVRERMAHYEEQGIIRGYRTILAEDRIDPTRVTAVIEVKVTPQREGGFDQIARHISRFPEVQAVHLVSGDFDLLLFVAGENLRDVASFVSEKLSPLQGVTATATHFTLKTYKQHGTLMESQDAYEKLKVSP